MSELTEKERTTPCCMNDYCFMNAGGFPLNCKINWRFEDDEIEDCEDYTDEMEE